MSAQRLEPLLPRDGRVIVLLTACVNPGNVVNVVRRDPDVRAGDYSRALRKWIRVNEIDGVVFCENSGADLTPIKELATAVGHTAQVEFLSFNGQDFDPSLGKGFGEMNIIRYAIDHSQLISDSQFVVKVTGRFFITNIRSIVRAIRRSDGIELFCDLRANLTSADSRVFCATPAFLGDYLLSYQSIVNDAEGVYFENALARAAHQAMADGRRCAALPHAHRMIGVAGTNGRPVPSGIVNYLRRELFGLLKAFALKR
jgi:hypothetical protein